MTEMSRFWWWVLLCALVGSAFFNAFNFILPNQFESRVAITSSFDFSNSAYWNDKTMLKLTQSLEPAFYSPETLISVLIQADQVGIELTETDFRKHTTVEQHNYGWVLITHFKDAATSTTIANLWSNAVFLSFQQDREILVKISEANQTYEALVHCLRQVTTLPEHPTCNIENLPALQSKMRALTQENNQIMTGLHYLPIVPPEFMLVQSQGITSPSPYISTFQAAMPLFGAITGIAVGIVTLRKNVPQKALKKVSPFPFEP